MTILFRMFVVYIFCLTVIKLPPLAFSLLNWSAFCTVVAFLLHLKFAGILQSFGQIFLISLSTWLVIGQLLTPAVQGFLLGIHVVTDLLYWNQQYLLDFLWFPRVVHQEEQKRLLQHRQQQQLLLQLPQLLFKSASC